jgi:cytochrome c-type biogenesis protein CcmH
MAVVLLLALGLGRKQHQTFEQKVTAVARTVKCPQCPTESAAESDATAAQGVRTEIANRLREGQSPDQIRSYFSEKYGESILLTPSRSGFESLVWILPVVGVALGLAGLAFAFRRWRHTPDALVSDEDRRMVEEERKRRRDEEDGGR